MGRIGLSPDVVAAAAADLVDREGPASLTLARVAGDLGVRSPSLYNHVDGLEGLERAVALRGIEQLGEECTKAVMGRSGEQAVRQLAIAYRRYAQAHPGVYPLTQVARPGDTEYETAARTVLEPVLAVLTGMGFAGDELIHAARAMRSALHGFAVLEAGAGFGLDVDLDRSFEWLVEMIEQGLSR
ncbi:MAG: TetR-like C-terminal domain-containing protein [Acidimicrobiia bacterium]|nr:TetR-like C-terminal domain-containing protein [Acidimicrobiia bacterium]